MYSVGVSVAWLNSISQLFECQTHDSAVVVVDVIGCCCDRCL